jgi:hypothetical protein
MDKATISYAKMFPWRSWDLKLENPLFFKIVILAHQLILILPRPDFHDLFAYNFSAHFPVGLDQPRPPLRTNEAIRLIIMELEITSFSAPDANDGQEFPVVHFEGVSRSITSRWDPNANANIRGTVRMTKEGEVRWQTISVYGGWVMLNPFIVENKATGMGIIWEWWTNFS